MATTRDDIRGWLMEGKRQEATHCVIVCDTFDWTDYPVYVRPDQQIQDVIDEHNNADKCCKVMEVYNLNLPFYPQITETRAWNL